MPGDVQARRLVKLTVQRSADCLFVASSIVASSRLEERSEIMTQIPQALITGVTSFIATNIDDIAVLTLLFSRTAFRPRHIVVGQYVGFLGLVLASLPGYFGRIFLPHLWLGWLGLLPIAIGSYYLIKKDSDEETVKVIPLQESLGERRSPFANLLSPQTYQVAAITLANGGDNIGIYVPLFANNTLISLGIILCIFGVMIGLWCSLAYQLARHPWVAQTLAQYGHRIVPFVLIGLGIFIFVDGGTDRLPISRWTP
jgi:cadmium resistance transport/sequestration family protein